MNKKLLGLLVIPLLIGANVASAEVGGTITKSFVPPVPPTHIETVYDKTNPDIMLIASQDPTYAYRSAVNALITGFLQIVDWQSAAGTLHFTATNYSFNNGCNTLFGTYSIDGATIHLGTTASTMMACETEKMDADQALSKKLAVIEHITFKDGQLLLSGKDTIISYSPKFRQSK